MIKNAKIMGLVDWKRDVNRYWNYWKLRYVGYDVYLDEFCLYGMIVYYVENYRTQYCTIVSNDP